MAGKAVKEAPKDVHGVVWWRALPALHQQQLAELWIAVTVVSPPPPALTTLGSTLAPSPPTLPARLQAPNSLTKYSFYIPGTDEGPWGSSVFKRHRILSVDITV